MKKILLYILFLAVQLSLHAQNIDSAEALLKNAKQDTNKLNLLYYLSENADSDKWPAYNEQMLQLSLVLSTNSNRTIQLVAKNRYAAGLNNKGLLLTDEGKFPEAIGSFSLSASILSQLKDSVSLVQCLENMSYTFYKMNNNDESISALNRCLVIQKAMNDSSGCASTLNKIGIRYDFMGNDEKAMEYYEKALVISKKIGDKETTATLLNNMALLYKNKGDLAKSLQYNFESLKIKDEAGMKAEMVYSYNNLAAIYLEQGNPEKALQYFFLSLELCSHSKKPQQKAMVLGNIGSVLMQMNSYDRALPYFMESLDIYKKEFDNQGIAGVLHNVGNIYVEKGRIPKAISFLEQSIRIKERLNDKSGMVNSLEALGNAYLKQGIISKAEGYGTQALRFANETGYPELIKNCAGFLQMIYEKENKYQKAYEMSRLFLKMKDSLYNVENKSMIVKNQMKYEYEKKSLADSLKVSAERESHRSELKQEKQTKYTLYAGMALLVVFGSIMYNRFKVTTKQKSIIEEKNRETNMQKAIIEEKQKEILDSIHYAKQIQSALLAQKEMIDTYIPENFILFKPKDIVSGDFYWSTFYQNRFYLAVCDSTGHGVPGAFMSLLNIGFLSEAIKEKNIEKPNEVLDYARARLIESISSDGQKDGMDGILLCIEKTGKITYAAAHNKPLLVAENEVKVLSSDKMPVGKGERNEPFQLYTIEGKPGNVLYLYTDGFADQFGGPKGKKFKYRKLDELLVQNSVLAMDKQSELLNTTFENWRGGLEQVDDVLVIGVKL